MSEKKLKLFSTLRDAARLKELTIPFEDGQTVRGMIQCVVGLCAAADKEHGQIADTICPCHITKGMQFTGSTAL